MDDVGLFENLPNNPDDSGGDDHPEENDLNANEARILVGIRNFELKVDDFEGDDEARFKLQRLFNVLQRRVEMCSELSPTENTTVLQHRLRRSKAAFDTLVEAACIATPQITEVPVIERPSHLPVAKWKLTFTGAKNDSVAAFLERVEEMCIAKNVPKPILFREALDLFEGSAKIWFRNARKHVANWSELVKRLKEDFQPPAYDDRLWEEIKSRSQGAEERSGMYIAIMDNLFSRLTVEPTEEQKLAIIRGNLHPYLVEKLCLHEISTVDELRHLLRKAEDAQATAAKYHPPPAVCPSLLEPDLACQSARTRNPRLAASNPLQAEKEGIVCWNCKIVGHGHRNCQQPRRKFCYRCGRPGVVASECLHRSEN